MKNPKLETWVSWLAATLVAALTLSAFAFTTFQTKDDAKESKADLVQRLDRMEHKIDNIIMLEKE